MSCMNLYVLCGDKRSLSTSIGKTVNDINGHAAGGQRGGVWSTRVEYRQLREKLRALQTALPLIGDLHSPAMRPRHWQQLGVATGHVVVADDRLTLGAMLDLQLHRYVLTGDRMCGLVS